MTSTSIRNTNTCMPPTNSDFNRFPSLEEFRAFVVDLSPNRRLLPSVSNSRVEGLGMEKSGNYQINWCSVAEA